MRKSRQICIGNVAVGGGAPVSVQSMTNTRTSDAAATAAQILELADNGCQLVRVAVPDFAAADALPEIIARSPIPVIADIHFDYRLALRSIAAGVHAIRINPGNIGGEERVALVAEHAGNAGIPIRVGANSGSLPEGMLEEKLKSGIPHNDALVQSLADSALLQCRMLEKYGFKDIKVSLKASDVPVTVAAFRRFARETDYPLHIGVTEAGTMKRGTVKSAVGIGALLLDGIGDTVRVSLTAPPVEEVRLALMILECAGLRSAAPEIVSCPTCGRTEIDLIALATRVEALIDGLKAARRRIKIKKIAVMGCVVNGPGEARDAELGIAGGKGKVMLFRKGEVIGVYPEEEGFEKLKAEILKESE